MPEVDISPYILVSSHAHKDFEEETKKIEAPIESEFKSTTYREIKHLFDTMAEANSDVDPSFFLLLDEQSPKDRTVVIMQKCALPLNSEGAYISGRRNREKPTKIRVEWSRHRVPYDETGTAVALFVAHG